MDHIPINIITAVESIVSGRGVPKPRGMTWCITPALH